MSQRFIGIDAGSFSSPSWIAELEGNTCVLDVVRFSPDEPTPLGRWLDDPTVGCVAVDAPSGLPDVGVMRRKADEAINSPTRRLPNYADELQERQYRDGKRIAYIAVIELGLDLFFKHRDEVILANDEGTGRLVETYPRAVLNNLLERYLGPEVPKIPSKRKASVAYIELVTRMLSEVGIHCPGVRKASVDQCDAMLCALAARGHHTGHNEHFGRPAVADETFLRRGIVSIVKSTS